jgi:hypothetical protein
MVADCVCNQFNFKILIEYLIVLIYVTIYMTRTASVSQDAVHDVHSNLKFLTFYHQSCRVNVMALVIFSTK